MGGVGGKRMEADVLCAAGCDKSVFPGLGVAVCGAIRALATYCDGQRVRGNPVDQSLTCANVV